MPNQALPGAITIRALGRGTRKLYNDLREGLADTLHGPYGMFDHTLGGPRQTWIAGGIGIAPFLGWLSHPSGTRQDRPHRPGKHAMNHDLGTASRRPAPDNPGPSRMQDAASSAVAR